MAEMTPERIAGIREIPRRRHCVACQRKRRALRELNKAINVWILTVGELSKRERETRDALARAQQEIADLREALGKIAVHAECGVDEGRCRPLGIIAKAALAQGTPAGKA